MKHGLYRATVIAVGTLALSAALRNDSLQDLIVEGALTGGGLWASATASVGNFGQSAVATRQ
jgi:hypothetical protein